MNAVGRLKKPRSCSGGGIWGAGPGGSGTAPMLRSAPMRRVLAIAVAMLLLGAAAADARTCRSADLRYPFMAGGPKTFGVFKLRIDGGSCATAHSVAKTWMGRFEANLRAERVRLPKSVQGFTFKPLPAHAAQTYTERGRKASTTIRFDYVVPNG